MITVNQITDCIVLSVQAIDPLAAAEENERKYRELVSRFGRINLLVELPQVNGRAPGACLENAFDSAALQEFRAGDSGKPRWADRPSSS